MAELGRPHGFPMVLRLLWLGKSKSLPKPFLYAKLNMKPAPHPEKKPTGLVNRLLKYGETRWHGLSAYPSDSIRSRIYQLGSRLVDRIPMQERMLWRVYHYSSAGHSKFGQPMPAIEYAPGEEGTARINEALSRLIDRWIALHFKWRLIHGLAIGPAVILSVLPFVKLWLAWTVFRTVTHHRALTAASWLKRSLARRPAQQLLPNPDLASSDLTVIDSELPDILRKINNFN